MIEDKKEIIPSVSISEFTDVLPILYRAKEVPVLVISHTGIGKTRSVKHFCDKNDLEYRNIRLSYIEAQDIVGFPQIKDNKMVYIQPDFLPQGKNSKGVLFFDEINRARIDVLQAVFQLILERELGVGNIEGEIYKLPNDWFIIASQNPDTDEYYVSPMDAALFNRFLIIPVKYNENAFKEYIRLSDNEYNPMLSNFIRKEELRIKDEDINDIAIHPTPRSFELFNIVLNKILPGEFHLLHIIGNGLIGPSNFKNFATFKYKNNPRIDQLFNDILSGKFEKTSDRDKITVLENENLDVVLGVLDRFVEKKMKEEKEFDAITQNCGFQYFLNFTFELSNEQTVSTLLGIRKALEKWSGGHKYLPSIENFMDNNMRAKDKYNVIMKNHSDLKVEEFI